MKYNKDTYNIGADCAIDITTVIRLIKSYQTRRAYGYSQADRHGQRDTALV